MPFQDLFTRSLILLLVVETVLVGFLVYPIVTSREGICPTLRRALLIVWCVALIVFIGYTLTEPPKDGRHRSEADSPPISETPYSTCLVFSFPDASALFLDNKPQDKKVAALPQDPSGCIDELNQWLDKSKPRQLILTGRTDRRELSPSAAAIHNWNASLAYDRARAVRHWLDDRDA